MRRLLLVGLAALNVVVSNLLGLLLVYASYAAGKLMGRV